MTMREIAMPPTMTYRPIAWRLGWHAHEQGQDRDRLHHPHARELAVTWERDWLAGWDARHKAMLRAMQEEGT